MTIELESLVGTHELSGAFFDMSTETMDGDHKEECQVLRFTLDGTHLEAVENPDDGYRSNLKEVRHTELAPATKFPSVKVECVMKTVGEYGGEDIILQMLNPATKKAILEIGTSNVDDYYPGFVGYFSPENI